MKVKIIFVLLFICAKLSAQMKPGDPAPNFMLQMQNGMQGFSMPYMNRIVFIHFWSTSVLKSKQHNKALNRMASRYKNAIFKTAEGFVAVSIAVQSDRNAWQESIKSDSLTDMVHGIASRGYNDDVCKKFGINTLSSDILIDENGIILAVNPSYSVLEEILDEKKNYQPIKKDIGGTLAISSNSSEFYKFARVNLYNGYDDSLGTAITDEKGKFLFNDMKLNHDYVIKVHNQANILVSDPLALYNVKGDRLMTSESRDNSFMFFIPANLNSKIIDESEEIETKVAMVNVNKYLNFKQVGSEWMIVNEFELKSFLDMMKKDQNLVLEFTCHASTKIDSKTADELTRNHVNTIKNYFTKKGINASKLLGSAKGIKEPLNACGKPNSNCTDGQHQLNLRTQFLLYKN